MPLLSETSLQAQFLKPMAASLAFGVVFATTISLFLVPCSYVILEDLKALLRREKSASPALEAVRDDAEALRRAASDR